MGNKRYEKYKKSYDKYREKNKEKMKEYQREYKQNNKKNVNERNKKFMRYYRKRPEVKKRDREYNYGRKFYLDVVSFTNQNFKKSSFCSICKCNEKLQFHHFRYRIPVQRQDFTTLCNPCHEITHSQTSTKMKNGNKKI